MKTAFEIAKQFMGVKEIAGQIDNPQILAFLNVDRSDIRHDETPWCSGFPNYIAKLLDLPRSKSLLARSWLKVGIPVELKDAKVGYDIVILKRSGDNQPGPEVINAPGHVGFYAGMKDADREVLILGGNQNNMVNISAYSIDRVLGVRRLKETQTIRRVAMVDKPKEEKPKISLGEKIKLPILAIGGIDAWKKESKKPFYFRQRFWGKMTAILSIVLPVIIGKELDPDAIAQTVKSINLLLAHGTHVYQHIVNDIWPIVVSLGAAWGIYVSKKGKKDAIRRGDIQ